MRLCEAYNKILTQNTHNRLSNVGPVVSQVADSSKSLHIHTHKEEHTYSHSNMCTTLLDWQRRPCSLSLLSILSDMLKIKTRKLNHFVVQGVEKLNQFYNCILVYCRPLEGRTLQSEVNGDKINVNTLH